MIAAVARPARPQLWAFLPPTVAAALAIAGLAMGWRGVDLPAQIYRVGLFHQQGFTLWDSQWYGGHWTLDYSVLFPPLAGVVGVNVTAVVSAAVAAWAFDRMAIDHFGRSARAGSLAFATGTLVQLAIGQLPFLLGEALGLLACWAATRRRWPLAIGLAVATSLASPLAGAFLALAGVAWLLGSWPVNRARLTVLVAGVALPVAILAVLFPGQGFFPFPAADFAFEGVACVVMLALVPRHEPVLRAAARLYLLATAASFVLPTAVGGNVGRLGECIAIPLAACVLWPLRRWLLTALALPMALWSWSPAWGAISNRNSRDPSTHQSYFDPLVAFLAANNVPLGRVEVVPTRFHWEAAYVAPSIALARGWERQLDTAVNPLFYDRTPLDPLTYESWLIDNGVRFVALPDAPLDFAAVAEAGLVTGGLPDLQPVWHDDHWRVFEVAGSAGILDGPGHVIDVSGGHAAFHADAAGTFVLRVHFTPGWTLTTGAGCVRPTAERWMSVDVSAPGEVDLDMRLVGGSPTAC
ncbi:MAG: MFS transporter [Acidimicrobiales bacterium]